MVTRGTAYGTQPAVKNLQTFVQILESPGTTHLFTFSAPGRIWGASVSYAMGCTGGAGTQQGYARVHINGGNTLAIVEACIAGAVANDSDTSDRDYPGLAVPAGTVVNLDVNGGTGVTGGVNRGSGLVAVSIP